MSNEWKKLQIDNLPSDILTGDYEFEWMNDGNWTRSMPITVVKPLENILLNGFKYRYRKPEPLPPTHSEIMTNFWQMPVGCQWWKVESYQHGLGGSRYWIGAQWQTKQWFTNRESAIVPPEAE